jgi:hypothetical protein
MSRELKDIITGLNLTAIYEEAEEGGYIGYIAELPGRTRRAKHWMRCARIFRRRCG